MQLRNAWTRQPARWAPCSSPFLRGQPQQPVVLEAVCGRGFRRFSFLENVSSGLRGSTDGVNKAVRYINNVYCLQTAPERRCSKEGYQ